jgi:hypothetical protein
MSEPVLWSGRQVDCIHCGQSCVPTFDGRFPGRGFMLPWHPHPDGTRCVGSYSVVIG